MFVFKPKGRRLYRGRFRLSNGTKWYEVPLRVEQKHVAETLLRKLVREREEEIAGLIAPKAKRESAQRSLMDHCREFLADAKRRNCSRSHLVHLKCRLEKLLADCGWRTVADVTADSFNSWVRAQDFSSKTLNEYLGHASAFLNWMVRHERIAANPLRAVQKLPKKETFRRRALTPVELMKLVASNRKRSLRYLFAGCTGIRRGEMKQLLWADVHLDAEKPYVELRAEITKSKRADLVPLVPVLVEALRAEKAKGVPRSGRLFPRGLPSAKALAADLTACGIPVVDERGYRVDFHSLRHTFATMLGTAGVSELARVKLARHTEWKMTDRYTDPKGLPHLAEIVKLDALLRSQTGSQIGSQNAVQAGPELSKGVQGTDSARSWKVVDFEGESPGLSKADPGWEITQNGAQGGTRTPMRLGTGF